MRDFPVVPPVIADPKVQMDLVHGTMPDSYNEYFVALALDRLNMDYSFQVPLGTPGLRGSQTIDFVVWKATGGVPVFVQGAHWHDITSETEDLMKQAAAKNYYKTEPILLMEEETNTLAKAIEAVKTKIGF